MLRSVMTIALSLGVTLSACGDSDSMSPDPGPSSGFDTGTPIVDLSEEDVSELCDWAAGRFGGYGRSVTCVDNSTVSARQTRELCLMDYGNASSTCTATVGDIEQCTNQAVAQPRCATVPPACFALVSCI